MNIFIPYTSITLLRIHNQIIIPFKFYFDIADQFFVFLLLFYGVHYLGDYSFWFGLAEADGRRG